MKHSVRQFIETRSHTIHDSLCNQACLFILAFMFLIHMKNAMHFNNMKLNAESSSNWTIQKSQQKNNGAENVLNCS